MIEIRWHARAGQGAVTAAKALADAAIAEGKYVQAFPDYGPERMGAPVKAFNRIAEEPIQARGIVESPSVVVVVDPTLVGADGSAVTASTSADAVFIVNTSKTPAEAQRVLGANRRVFTVDANAIAQETIGLRKPNTPMLGALARVTGIIEIETLLAKTEISFGKKFDARIVEGNLQAIRRAYDEVAGALQPEVVAP